MFIAEKLNHNTITNRYFESVGIVVCIEEDLARIAILDIGVISKQRKDAPA